MTTATIEKQIAASGDDGFTILGALSVVATANQIGNNAGNTVSAFCRFLNITIAQGLTIDSATVTFVANSSQPATSCDVTIAGEKAANASAPISYAEFNAATRTTATVAWSLGATVADSTFVSPDITTIIQEIVNQSNWQSGNAIQIFLDDDSSAASAFRDFKSYDGSVSESALLTITYQQAFFRINSTWIVAVIANWIDIPAGQFFNGKTSRNRWRRHIWKTNVMTATEFDSIYALQGQRVSIITTDYDDRNNSNYKTYYNAELMRVGGDQNGPRFENIQIEFNVRV